VPPAAATVPAALGATVLTVLWTEVLVTFLAGRTIQGDPQLVDVPWHGSVWQVAVFGVAYAPLLLWGPLLAAVTVAYHQRRRATRHGHRLPVALGHRQAHDGRPTRG
jgi:hypothetical protein